MSDLPARQPSTFSRYLRAVLRHGVGIWTGAAVTIGTWLVDMAVENGWIQAEWWPEPTLAFYVIAGTLGLAVAQYLAWRDLETERNESRKAADHLSERVEHLEADVNRLQTASILSILPAKAPRKGLLGRGMFSPQMSFKTLIDNLDYAWPKDEEGNSPGYPERVFAVVRVGNDGGKNARGLVARCFVLNSKEEMRVVWSRESGNTFFPGGGHAADLNAGDYRLLVLAQAVGQERLWCLLPSRGPIYKGPVRVLGSTPLRFQSQDGEVLNRASELEIMVWFSAESFSRKERFRLGFAENGTATIEHLTATLPANPAPSTVSEQSRPPSPESS